MTTTTTTPSTTTLDFATATSSGTVPNYMINHSTTIKNPISGRNSATSQSKHSKSYNSNLTSTQMSKLQ